MKLLDRLIAGLWFTVEARLPPPQMVDVLENAFAVDAQPVADWIYGEYKCTPEQPDYFDDGDHPYKDIIGTPLMKLPLHPLWCEWKQLDGTEVGVIYLECPTAYPHKIGCAFYRRIKDSDRAEYLGDGFFETDDNFEEVNFTGPVGMGWIALDICEATITFFHCKNVKLVPAHRPHRLVKRMQKKLSMRIVPTFHTIEIHLPSLRYVGAMRSSKEGAPIIARIIRGHFKRYEGDSKLFGKVNGMWWWQMHVAGDGDILKSEYRTHPPDKHHASRCLINRGRGRKKFRII